MVCVLHGDPTLPAWMDDESVASALHLVVNDDGPGRYLRLPPARSVHRNDTPLGFAHNVNAALGRLWGGQRDAPDLAICANFDLELVGASLTALAHCLRSHPGAAAAAPRLTDRQGRPVFSVGTPPTALKEFTRAVGLREGGLQRALRAVLRRRRSWQTRNQAGSGSRLLGPDEYLPWTCLALRRAAWEEVGPLDERFPMYGEDIDWGRRAAAGGWSAVLVDVGRVVHQERATHGARTNAMYELSHARLHAKYGDAALGRWQSRGLTARRVLGRGSRAGGALPPLDWDYLRQGLASDGAAR